jgi:hypothetical protein
MLEPVWPRASAKAGHRRAPPPPSPLEPTGDMARQGRLGCRGAAMGPMGGPSLAGRTPKRRKGP